MKPPVFSLPLSCSRIAAARCWLALAGAVCATVPAQASIKAEDIISCLVLPWETVALAASSEGVVQQIFVDRGDRVTEGQLLVQLDDRVQRSYLELMQARAEDQSPVALARIRLSIAESGYERNKPLFERQQITGDDWDRIRGTYELALVELDQAERAAIQAELELARARAAHSHTRILAPTDAVVVQRSVAVGEMAANEPVLELAVIDSLKVEIFARAETYGDWPLLQEVPLAVDLPRPARLTAQTRMVNPVSDAATGVIGVLLSLDNADHAILPGQSCRLAEAG